LASRPPAFRIISIGTLAAHPLWDERRESRTGHSTCVLIESGTARVLVNPALPPTSLAARLSERTPTRPEQITHVFLTSFLPDHRRGLGLFESAAWLLHEPERQAAETTLAVRAGEARAEGDADLVRLFEHDLELLQATQVAPDRIAPGIDLFPLPGVTPGNCGLILPLAMSTVLVTGDAIASIEHLEQGKVLPSCFDVEQAQESFREAIEIADVLVPGRDNVMANPLRRLGR
jgi:glyoxylase-like metal-dependent hydrolase (beta-lactamase superfamily II)